MHFSVVIAAKNEEANIGRCLDSINSLSYRKNQYEVIVIDNGSADRTAEIARKKGAAVYVEPKKSISGLRNVGADRASGEVLAFVDADCTVDRTWLLEAERYLLRREVVAFGSPPIIPENATWVQMAWFVVRRKSNEVAQVDWLESMNLFVRREAFLHLGGFDEGLVTCEDYDLSVRLKRMGLLLNDSRLIVIHHGEAPTIVRFFKKELWRGAGNLRGLARHGLILHELPSIFAPFIHWALIAVACIGFPLYPAAGYKAVMVSLGCWQSVLFLTSVWKCSTTDNKIMALQLYVLLNVYLFARGLAAIRRR